MGSFDGELGEARCFELYGKKLVSPIGEDMSADLVV
jgi:hypothetical protein